MAAKPAKNARSSLRAAAEASLERCPPPEAPHQAASNLQHELQVHEIELELQNEELRRAQVALDHALERQVDLYDFAPVGYLTLDAQGTIVGANLTAAGMLNVPRKALIGRRFGAFVADDAARWQSVLQEVAWSTPPRSFDAAINRSDGSIFDGHLICQHRATGADGSVRVVLSDVTEQRRLEKELGESRRYVELMQRHPVPLMMVDTRRQALTVNDSFTRLLGYATEDIPTTDDWFSAAYPDDGSRRQAHEAWDEAVRRAMSADGELEAVERRVRCKGGEERTVLVTGKPVGDDILVSFVDITDRKRAEEALRVQQSRLDLAVRSGQAGLWDLDLVTDRAWRTLQHDRLFGYDALQPSWGPEDALRHVVPEDRPIFQRALEEALSTGRLHYQLRIDPVNQPRRWIEANGEVYRDDSGKAVRMAGTVVDITDRKESEERIREAAAYARSLLEASLDPLVTISPEGKITDVNAATEAATGIPRDELVGTDFADYFTEPEMARAGYRQVLATGSVRDYPLSIRHASGRSTEVVYNATLYRDPDGSTRGVFAAARDISELRVLQAQVALASRLAAMGTLVAGVAHEINNPLAAELADEGVALEIARELRDRLRGTSPVDRQAEVRLLGDAVEALEEAQESGLRIARIVKSLTTFGRPTPRRSRIRLRDVVAEAMRWLPATVANAAIVRFEDGGAPEVDASFGQIEQVVVNLVTNAAKAIPAGRRGIVVVRTGPGSPGMSRLEVIDDGDGIDPAHLERIFEPFFTTRAAGAGRGMGLGLAICHSIVASHGGTLTVESQVGKGSTFRMELPIGPEEAAGRPA